LSRGEETFEPSVFSYDSGQHDFRSLICGIFGTSRLESLHDSSIGILKRGNDQSTEFHRKFYENFTGDGDIHSAYLKFIDDVIAPIFGEPFCYQAVPTFRIHLPGNVAVGEFHKDGDYNHSPGEVNFWVPFTKASGTNSVFIETALGSGEFKPADVSYGEVLTFDAVRWLHGNRLNDSGQTRVSFDFRCVAMSLYRPTGLKTVNVGKTLEIGDYFERSSRFGASTQPAREDADVC
jgi:hypothetical protein